MLCVVMSTIVNIHSVRVHFHSDILDTHNSNQMNLKQPTRIIIIIILLLKYAWKLYFRVYMAKTTYVYNIHIYQNINAGENNPAGKGQSMIYRLAKTKNETHNTLKYFPWKIKRRVIKMYQLFPKTRHTNSYRETYSKDNVYLILIIIIEKERFNSFLIIKSNY